MTLLYPIAFRDERTVGLEVGSLERLLVYDGRWIGRPLTDAWRRSDAIVRRGREEPQVIAPTTERQRSSHSGDEERRLIARTTKRQPSSQSLDTASHYAILAGFTALFLLGTFIGTAAVLIAVML